jgi:hypothetical protein
MTSQPAGSMVFVVDDDDSMRESLRSLIRSTGLSDTKPSPSVRGSPGFMPISEGFLNVRATKSHP